MRVRRPLVLVRSSVVVSVANKATALADTDADNFLACRGWLLGLAL